MNKAKKLIEVALPVKEISAESVRDKSIRHGHISTLHLWWARRPLPVCRAIVFASLVPDPLDENCPQQFKDAVKLLLSAKTGAASVIDYYKPYQDIPYTNIEDVMEDNLRNRLLMFIGKFSDIYIENEKKGKKTPAKKMLSDLSLIKWENKNNDKILEIARKLIWVANDPGKNTLEEFDKYFSDIKKAEDSLHKSKDRHKKTKEIKEKEKILQDCKEAFLDHMPKVFDPFAGGGAIPLEAARLGCRTYGNDINPVAHIIQRASVEFPQKYGKPIEYSYKEFEKLYEVLFLDDVTHTEIELYEDFVEIKNRLAFDVEYYCRKMLFLAESEIGHLYPPDETGNEIVAYYWARTAKCSNPACGFEIPLVGTKYLCKKSGKKVAYDLIPNHKSKTFSISIKENSFIDFDTNGTVKKSKMKCPVCGSVSDSNYLKNISRSEGLGKKLIAVIYNGEDGKKYCSPENAHINYHVKENLNYEKLPKEKMQKIPDLVSGRGWGIDKWIDIFSDRQLLVMQTMIAALEQVKEDIYKSYEKDYAKAVITYLAILINRISMMNTTMGRWNVSGEKIEHPFSRQAIPMIFDYPESYPFCDSTGSAKNHLKWILRYINTESKNTFSATFYNSTSGDNQQFKNKELSSVVTDPPYYNAIAYADLSDFFYVWLKRTIKDIYPENLATPQTPKSEECTALKHHHNNNEEKANQHFEDKLLEIFKTVEKQTAGIVSIMFAHQSTEAWTTLCNSILNANMNITGSWAMNTEMESRVIALGNAALQSSVTVSCQPIAKEEYGDYSEVKKAIKQNIKKEVRYLYSMGFRGADLLTSCFGQAASEIGKYKVVEKADGSEVTVSELLQFARESAFESIISDIDTDDVTRFYIGWLNLFGFSEADHDEVQRITQIGLAIDLNELQRYHILMTKSSKHNLSNFIYRIDNDAKLGLNIRSKDIDKVHRAMYIYSNGTHRELVLYLSKAAPESGSSFWRVLNSLSEVLPKGIADHQAAIGILTGEEGLLREVKQNTEEVIEQTEIEF
jgi:putative DNA methylase